METQDTYDYSLTMPHLRLFIDPLKDEPFIPEMADAFRPLWEFKPHIQTWSFGINRWKNYVYLRYRIDGKTTYLPWNEKEKVMLIEEHQKNYVVLVLREVDSNGNAGDHCHSIVINVNSEHGKFDLENLMAFLEGSQMESLNVEFERNHYVPWVNSTAKSNASRLRLIFQTLDRYALEHCEIQPDIGQTACRERRLSGSTRPESTSTPPPSGSRGTRAGQARSEAKKRGASEAAGVELSRKRKKSLTSGHAGAGSSASALTTVSARNMASTAEQPDYVKFAELQKTSWAEHKDCFLNDRHTVPVHISQCIIASDQFVIRTLQRDITEAVKKELIQLIDVKQR